MSCIFILVYCSQIQSELQSVREELARERQSCEDLKQKLAAAEKELKSSAVMNLELEDYQRSMKTLEEQLTTRSSELEKVRKDGQLQQDAMMQIKKELGSAVLHVLCMYSSYSHVHVHTLHACKNVHDCAYFVNSA